MPAFPVELDLRKLLVNTPRFSVERRAYARKGAKPLIRDVIVHPGAVVILPFLADDRIVMVRQYRHSVERELLELPAGTIEPNEKPIETARRELIEETGYEAGSIQPLAEFFTSPGILTERMYAFVARDLTHVGQALEHDEQLVVEPMGLDAARLKLMAGELHDAKTMAALGLYLLQAKH